ncbi:MAG: hypothetical protein WBK08_16215 [Nitrospira sp.]|nr:MAG: hypothetical protein E8D42_15450 [Nitrospira sp.]
MSQVLLHLSLWNSEYGSQLLCGHASIRHEIGDALTQGPLKRQHVRMVRTGAQKIQMVGAGPP